MKQFTELVQDWFDVHSGGGLILPDGWFGRPHDNIHELTFLVGLSNWLIMELDEQLLLTIRDPEKVSQEKDNLVISGFASCNLDWKEYGSSRGHVSHYEQGEIRLVPVPGA